MSLLLTAMGWLGEAFIKSLVEKLGDHAFQQFVVQHEGGNDLFELKTSLVKAKHIISGAENMWIKDENLKQRLKELLMQLKDAVYDAEDLQDEIQYQVLKQKMEQRGDEACNLSSSSSSIPPRKKMKISLPDFVSGLFGREDDVNRLGEIQVRLDKITDAIEKEYNLLGADGTREKEMVITVNRTTSSFLVETHVFGREKELNELKGLLLKSADGSGSSSSNNISVLTIVGMGGVGKTTLAQQAYNSQEVKEYFDLKIWICVSEDFNVERLTKEIIRNAEEAKECATGDNYDLMSHNQLQMVLNEKTAPKRFLLVLDDVWNEDRHKWGRLCSPLRSGLPGSRILVTTRSTKIADMVGDVNAIHLNGLDDENYWEFFKKCAFGPQYTGEHPELEAIAKEIALRQKGLPLAARTLGGLLNVNLDKNHWLTIKRSEIWQLPQDENDVLPVLQLSYQYLPAHLKRCFTYCSVFPKDHLFREDDLIRIWMAEGFIAAPENIRMEDLGSDYLHELVSRYFFEKSQKQWSGGNYYVMHDLIHDLAQLISEGETRRLEYGKPREISSMVHHLSVHVTKDMDPKSFREFQSFNKLRTLSLPERCNSDDWLSARNLIERLKSIRVLILRQCGLQELPETIGHLILLRYLDISFNRGIRRLPESICGLHNLQTLILQRLQLQSLPKGMSKLINLRQLDADYCLVSQIHEVGKLTSLQKLREFRVLKDEGHKLAELNGLSQLREFLHIINLENVESIEEARKARLDNKECLDELVLEWASNQGSSDLENNALLVSEEEVLDGLQPHHSLKRLTIRGYSGARPPSWMVAGVPSKLEFLELENCKRWEDVSCVGELPHLKVLHVMGMPMVKQINDKLCGATGRDWFPRLEQLWLEDLMALEELPKVGKLQCLKILRIKGISAVKKIGRGSFGATDQGECFPRLEELVFTDMPAWEEWSWVAELFPCLRMLEISGCPELKRLPPTWPPVTRFKELTSLQQLRIIDCPKLMSMTQDEDNNLLRLPPSIKELQLSGNPGKSLPGYLHNLTSLTKLEIYDCPNLVSLPREALLQLKNLWSLTIIDCDELRSIEGLGVLKSLRNLRIARCPNLLLIEGGGEQGDEGLSLFQLVIDDTALLKLSPLRKTLPSIKYLNIESSDQVIMFDGEEQELLRSLTSLDHLQLFNCEKLQSLPTELHALPCLEYLYVAGCPHIPSLPEKGLPSCLRHLRVNACHPMLTEQVAEMKRRLPSDV